MDNRFYLQALGVTSLFIVLLLMFWVASGGPATEAEIRNANSTRTAIAMTGSFLLQPRTRTPTPFIIIPTSSLQTSVPGSTPTLLFVPSPTNTSLLPQFNTPIPPDAPALTPLPTETAIVQTPGIPITGIQDPAEFARWYFARVWTERDYQNLWDNYLTSSFKANVGSGIFEDYTEWWYSVERVDVHSVDVIENNGIDAWVRVNITFHMKNGRVVSNQIYDYDFLYDASRDTWMFDASP